MPNSTYSNNGDQSNKDVEKGDSSDELYVNHRESVGGMQSAPGGTQQHYTDDGRRIITEDECWHRLGYSWPKWKKWMLLSSVFAVQVSMNFNTSVYPNALTPLHKHFGIGEATARLGQMIFLVFYAFGCELWAPWSEEFGRWPILQYVLGKSWIVQILTAD